MELLRVIAPKTKRAGEALIETLEGINATSISATHPGKLSGELDESLKALEVAVRRTLGFK